MAPVNLVKKQLATIAALLNSTGSPSTLLGQLLREYGTVIFGVGAARLLTFLASVILARQLGVEGFGMFSIAYTFAMLIGQLPGVLDTSFVRHYAMSSSETEKHTFVKAHLHIKLATLGLLALAAFMLSDSLATHVFNKEGLGQLLLLAILAGGFFSLFTTGLAYYQGRGQFFQYSSLYFAESLFGLLGIGAYVSFFVPSALGSVSIYTIVFGLCSAAVGGYLYVNSRLVSGASLAPYWQKLMRFSGWLIPSSLCYFFLQRIDLLLLARFADYSSLGLYGAAVRIVAIFSLFTGNLPVILLPKAAQAVQSPQAIRAYLTQSSLATLGILVLIASGVLWAPELLSVTLGPDYTGATGPLRLLLLSYVFIAISSPLSCLIYGVGRTDLIFAQRLLELGTALIAAFFLMPPLAELGAALSMMAAYGIGCGFVIFNAYRLVLRKG